MHLALPRGSGGAGGLGGGPEYAPEIGVAVSHSAAVGGGCWDNVDHACGRQEQAVGVAVAGALLLRLPRFSGRFVSLQSTSWSWRPACRLRRLSVSGIPGANATAPDYTNPRCS